MVSKQLENAIHLQHTNDIGMEWEALAKARLEPNRDNELLLIIWVFILVKILLHLCVRSGLPRT